ncbi:MAG: diphthine synthase [Thermoplasmata archaeon]|nr:diphthine synthase [Thermoplasmata archaeon]
MSVLWFVGLGLAGPQEIPPRVRQLTAEAGAVFAEEYTSRVSPGTMDALEREVGRPIVRVDRSALEAEGLVREALHHHAQVVLLVAGDPFVATTHVALRVAAESWGHEWRYVPGATVATAVPGFLGLQQYRFGRTVSIPFPEPNFTPRSPRDAIGRNRSAGLHTLVLLDLRPDLDRYLTANEALRILIEQDASFPPPLFPPEQPVAVAARVGRDDAAGWFGPIEALSRADFGPPLHALVVPALPLHFEEAAALVRFRLPEDRRSRPASPA